MVACAVKPGKQAQADPVGVNAVYVVVKTEMFGLAVPEHVQVFCFRIRVFMTHPRALAVPSEL